RGWAITPPSSFVFVSAGRFTRPTIFACVFLLERPDIRFNSFGCVRLSRSYRVGRLVFHRILSRVLVLRPFDSAPSGLGGMRTHSALLRGRSCGAISGLARALVPTRPGR